MKNKFSCLAFFQSGYCQKPFFCLVILCFAVLMFAGNVVAQSPGAASKIQSTVTDSQISISQDDALQAKHWGLKQEEWSRYQQLMRGPLGIYSPGIDPLTALGIEARNESERRRYAELQVQAEARRVEKELAYQRAYDEAWQRLYPSLLPVTGLAPQKPAPAASSQGRLAVFVQENCPACEARVKQLQSEGRAFDLFLVGSGDDAAIRRWAAKVGISPDKVRSRTITLNHDGGRWLKLSGSNSLGGSLPAVLREVEGQWRREP